jgi:flagellar hook-basal body complex protein FliE
MFAEMQRMIAQAQPPQPQASTSGSEQPEFAALLHGMVDQVNAAQKESSSLAQDFTQGKGGVELAEVMVAMQRARVHFETMLQVRNRLVAAYEEIMRMPM